MAKKTGSTGNFPNGKLNSSDEGEMNIGIDFGEPTCWIGLAKNDVINLIATLQEYEKLLE